MKLRWNPAWEQKIKVWWPWAAGLLGLIVLVVLSFQVTGLVGNKGAAGRKKAGWVQADELDPNRLTVWVDATPVDADAIGRQIEEFEAATRERVQLTTFPSEGEYRLARDAALAAGQPPDVFLISAWEAEALREAGALRPLDFSGEAAEGWQAPTIEPFRREQGLLAIPSEFTLLALYYNKALFDKEGIAYPGDHWKWDILVGISKKLYKPAVRDFATPTFGIEMPLGLEWWNALGWQADGGIYSAAGWQLGKTHAIAGQRKAFAFLHNYYRNLAVAAPPEVWPQGEFFLQGRSAMLIAGAELLNVLSYQSKFPWGVAVIPKGPARATALRVQGWAVSAKAARPEAAAQLAYVLATRSSRGGWLPARQDPDVAPLPPAQKVFYDMLPTGKAAPPLATALDVLDFVDQGMPEWVKEKDPNLDALIVAITGKMHGTAPLSPAGAAKPEPSPAQPQAGGTKR